MSITPEDFKKILKETVKEELKPVQEEMREIKDEVLGAVDKLTKKYENHEVEHVANLGTHDRLQGEINECREKLDLKISPVA